MKPNKDLQHLVETLSVPDNTLQDIPCFEKFLQGFIRIKEGSFSFKGREWLRQICQDKSKTIYILKARQVGISVYIASYIVWFLLKNPGLTAIYCTDRFDHVKQWHQDKLGVILDSPRLSKYLGDDTIKTTRFTNGSTLHKISAFADMNRARGISADLVIVDEAQGVHLQNLPDLLETQAMSNSPKTIIAGTGNEEGSEWQKLYLKSSQQEWIKDTWQGRESAISGYKISQELLFDIATLEEKKSQYTPAQFENEVLARFTQGLKIPLTPGIIRQSCIPDIMPTPTEIDRSIGPLYCGIDLAQGGQALTVITIAQYIDKNPAKIHIIDAQKSDQWRTEDQAEWLISILHNWEPDRIVVDNGGNNAVKQILQKEYGDKIIECWLGEQRKILDFDKFEDDNMVKAHKPDCMQKLIDLFTTPGVDGNNRVIIPMGNDHEWLVDHYTADEAVMSDTVARPNMVRYKRMKGRQDDALMSLLFLYIGYLVDIDEATEPFHSYVLTGSSNSYYDTEKRRYVHEECETDQYNRPVGEKRITYGPVENHGPVNKL